MTFFKAVDAGSVILFALSSRHISSRPPNYYSTESCHTDECWVPKTAKAYWHVCSCLILHRRQFDICSCVSQSYFETLSTHSAIPEAACKPCASSSCEDNWTDDMVSCGMRSLEEHKQHRKTSVSARPAMMMMLQLLQLLQSLPLRYLFSTAILLFSHSYHGI